MIEDARKAKVVNDETVFVEPTSENIGISIALNAALTGKLRPIIIRTFLF